MKRSLIGRQVYRAQFTDDRTSFAAISRTIAILFLVTVAPAIAALRKVALSALFVLFLLLPLRAAEPKRVLLVHSFGSAAPPFTVESAAFQNALVEKLGNRVDLDEVSLDMARYSDPDMQDALSDYLQRRQVKWQPDLVVPIGAPAGMFVGKYRERLFPQTPILYTSMDRRSLPPGALDRNAAYIGAVYDIPRLIEDILQVAPGTKNIAVVVGTTPIEKYWKEGFRQATERYGGKINFIYFDTLSFDQMLQRAKTLPPNSFILLWLLLRDAAGITHNEDEDLQRLHAVANAPINSIFDYQMGSGIVGGRLYQTLAVGREGAEMAVRILRGEPASSFPPRMIEPLPPRYDWRELHRWKIDEKRLPAGSTVLYRAPTAWKQYRGWIIGGVSVFLLETLLIAALLLQRQRHHKAAGALRLSEERYREVVESQIELVCRYLPDTTLTFVNGTYCRFFKKKRDELIGEKFLSLVPAAKHAEIAKMVESLTLNREPATIENEVLRPDGTLVWIEWHNSAPVNERGELDELQAVGRDITDRKKAEEASRNLAHASRLAVVGELTASIAHEINQPLGAILSNADAAELLLESESPSLDEVRRILADIRSDDMRASETIRHIRMLARKGRMEIQRIDLNELTQDVVRLAGGEGRRRKVLFSTKLAARPCVILGDRVHLQQVLMNLILNALDAMADTPEQQRLLTVYTHANGDGCAEVTVTDTGHGIPPDKLPRLFESFFTTKENGVGLGLAIARSIVEAHDGRISAENNGGVGATFRVDLPLECAV